MTHTYRVYRGKYGYVWMFMGADGCFGVQGHGKTWKQGKQRQKILEKGIFTALWPGKFPRTSCFLLFGGNPRICTQMDIYACRWMHLDIRARAERKTIEKEAQMMFSCSFCDACRGGEKQEVGRDA